MKKAALITGGAARIGKALVLALVERGYDIALHCRNSERQAVRLAGAVKRAGRECGVFCCDLSDPAAVSELIPAVAGRFPHCRLLVNNASVFERGTLRDLSPSDWRRIMAVNLDAPVFLTRSFAAAFRSGHVVNLCDAKAAANFTSHFAYTMSKKALLDFTAMSAAALGPAVRVNAVAPGLILPSMEFKTRDLVRLSAGLPLGRKGAVSDVVSAVLFLEDNPYVTGQVIFADGGMHLL
ncbi:MAG: SDR family oxidoreductase [bacterium]|nr:SDR family oxidoreductase [bacterium]